jgi:predicted dehydrogenase
MEEIIMSNELTTDRRGFLKTVAAASVVAEARFADKPLSAAGRKIKVGHIGCGNVAMNAYVPDIAAYPYIELVSTCDLIASRAERIAKKHGIPNCYYNVDSMLAGAPFDLLVNTTAMPAHFEVNLAALEAGRNVWSEKPMGLRLAEVKQLLEMAQRKGVQIWPAPTVVTSPQFKFMAETIASGKLGKIYSAHATYGHEGKLWSRWFFQKGGGALYDLGVYNVGTLTGLLGPAKSVVGMFGVSTPMRTVYPHDGPPGDVYVTSDDNTMLIIEHDNAVFSHIQTGYTYFSGRDDKDISATDYTIDFTGTDGLMHLVGYDWAPHGVDITYRGQPNLKMERFCTDPGRYTWQYGTSYIAECMATGKKSLITAEHGLHILEVMNAALQSQETGRRVKVESTFKWPIIT